MIRLTTALLPLGVGMAAATAAIAQGQNECFYGSCNPEASWCRLLCGSDPQYQNVRSQWHHRHAKHHHAKHHKGVNFSQARLGFNELAMFSWSDCLSEHFTAIFAVIDMQFRQAPDAGNNSCAGHRSRTARADRPIESIAIHDSTAS
jgi:hypothetical protein